MCVYPAELSLSFNELSEPSTLAASLIITRFVPGNNGQELLLTSTRLCAGTQLRFRSSGASARMKGCAGDWSRVFSGLSSQEASSSQGQQRFSQSGGFPGVTWPVLAWEWTASSSQVLMV